MARSCARLGRGILGAFFPDKCLVCGVYIRQARDVPPVFDDVKTLFDTALARLVCPKCLEKGFTPIHPPFCTSCGKPFSSPECENHLCSDCILAAEKGRSTVGRVRAFGCHELLLRDLVHQFKYGKKICLARPLGRLMFHTFMEHFSSSSPPMDIIVPVPLHIRRLRQRGFNQAYLLVRDFPGLWTAATGSSPGWSISNTILLRSRNTPSQTGFDRKDRLKNLRDAFTVKGKIKGKRILLIDDVYTTGATSGEAALTLFDAGALTVDLLVLVRA
ncbi:MAG: ComF family protein [Desulfobacterium sp.]|jgi:ComF family protein|nr:ComF family protein [Desulfobacterium sp.]